MQDESETMSKRKLAKRIKMELWVSDKCGINPKSREHQNVKVPVYFTIGELRTMLRALEPRPS